MFRASAYFRDWLEAEGCEDCIPVFHECGIDNPTDLLSLGLDDLRSLGVPETSLDRLWTAMSTNETTRPAARSITEMFSKRDSAEEVEAPPRWEARTHATHRSDAAHGRCMRGALSPHSAAPALPAALNSRPWTSLRSPDTGPSSSLCALPSPWHED